MPMRTRPDARPRPLDWSIRPNDAIDAWPDDRPLAAIVSGGEHPRWARWSVLASPGDASLVVRRGDSGPLGAMTNALRRPAPAAAHGMPFAGGWIGWLSYDMGREIEPAAAVSGGAVDDRGWPLLELRRCDGAYVFDHLAARWWAVGDTAALPPLKPVAAGRAHAFRAGHPVSATGREAYENQARRVLEYIGAGDVFQVNLSHRLTSPFEGSTRALLLRLMAEMAPWCGAYIESSVPGRCVLSMSPELFLEFDPATRVVTTRPMKGTRAHESELDDLLRSEKDRAELVMIVDVLRNDLGRVCDFGSVRVAEPREIERHGSAVRGGPGGLLQAVATVRGRLRDDASLADLIGAAFPSGSITGAPKIRAMQIIDELEPVRRGPYCGSALCISDCGRALLNVAIRTATVRGDAPSGDTAPHLLRGEIDYSVGAGIVADSDPAAEWEESMAKAAGYLRSILAREAAGACA